MSFRKDNFEGVYNQPNPRAYYASVEELEYSIPHHAQPIIRRCVELIKRNHNRRPIVLDLCAGYGVNGALLNHSLSLHELYAYYANTPNRNKCDIDAFSDDQLFFDNLRILPPLASVVGLDIADQAISYAKNTRLLDHGLICNLELSDPDIASQELIGTADLITITGGISYITPRSFRRLLSYFEPQKIPTIIWFSLSLTDTNQIIQTFESFGFQTIKSKIKFPQRRILSAKEGLSAERNQKLDNLVSENGYLYATLYISWHETNCLTSPNELACELSDLFPVFVNANHFETD